MNYRGLYISKCRDTGIEREDKNGNTVTAEGWFYRFSQMIRWLRK